MGVSAGFLFWIKVWKTNFKKLKTNVFVLVWSYFRDLILTFRILEKQTGFHLEILLFCISNTVFKLELNFTRIYWWDVRAVTLQVYDERMNGIMHTSAENKYSAEKFLILKLEIWSKTTLINNSLLWVSPKEKHFTSFENISSFKLKF